MGDKSKIEWTDATWNPATGCTKISAGCKHCYAETVAKRLQKMGQENYRNGFELTLHEHMLDKPLRWKKPRMIFVNSMSDMFHEDMPMEFIQKTFDVMNEAHWHTFQILTKRASRLVTLDDSPHMNIKWTPNIWMGVTVEDRDHTFRIDYLRETGAKTKFLSCEPLLSDLGELNLNGIDWVIVGGESGNGARPMETEWATSIRDQCLEQDVPFFFKQVGGVNKRKTGRLLEGRTWDEMPKSYQPVDSISESIIKQTSIKRSKAMKALADA